MENYNNILRYFGGDIQKSLSAVSEELCEIRLRTGRPLSAITEKGICFPDIKGVLHSLPEDTVKVTAEDVRRTFEAVCRYSIHSFQSRISKGFVTVSGGHRVGICGTAVYSPSGTVENIKYINGLNFRIAREIKGAADEIFTAVFNSGQMLRNILICGEPCSGKTTVLRDLCRQLGNIFPLSLVDERGELAAESSGFINNDVGICTDVFSGFSKQDGIISAVRAMSPRMIVCDEIGSEEDISALETAARSGVNIAASIHCSGREDLLSRQNIRQAVVSGMFDSFVFLKDRRIISIMRRDELLGMGRNGGVKG